MNGLIRIVSMCCVCELPGVSCLVDAQQDGSFSPTCLKCYASSIGHGGTACCFAEATHFVETVCLEAGWNPSADERRALAEVLKAYYPAPYDYSSCKECE